MFLHETYYYDFNFDSFSGSPDKFSLQQASKPITSHSIQSQALIVIYVVCMAYDVPIYGKENLW